MSLSQGVIVLDGTSSDGIAVECLSSQDEEDLDSGEKRPLLLLLRRLINNKFHTNLTNPNIIDILQNEFDICQKSSHELEIEINIEIFKKYLENWPQWKELERITTNLTKLKDFEALSKVLNDKYENLKEYLRVMLEAAKPLVEHAMKEVAPGKDKINKNIDLVMLEATKPSVEDTVKAPEKNKNTDSSDVVMEIQCTKEQLNELFFRRPRLDLNNTIFNMANTPPSHIPHKRLSYDQILNGWCISLSITLVHLVFTREVSYKLKHVLVNKVNHETTTEPKLQTKLQTLKRELREKKVKHCSRDTIIKQFRNILDEYAAQSQELYMEVESLFNILISEIKDTFDRDIFYKVPSNYRRYANKYKYVRYLYADNDMNEDPKYDLQLEETAAPMYYYYFGKITTSEKPILYDSHVGEPISEWMKFQCMFCTIKIPINTSIKEALESHFNDMHQNEVDWQCTHCKKTFSINYLLNKKWRHNC